MKIQRFNESIADDLDYDPELKKSKKLSKKINDFIIEFSESTDGGIIDWISYVANHNSTKLKEYKNISTPKKLKELVDSKNLTTIKEYADLNYESDKIKEEIKSLEKKVDEFLKIKGQMLTDTYNELFYTFQEDLILKDFDGFYNLFIKDAVDDDDYDGVFYEVHPNLWKKYGKLIKKILENNYPEYNEFLLKNATYKYNL